MKALMSSDSIQSMTWLTYGSELHNYLGSDIPKDYGGTAAPLAEAGLEPNYAGTEKKAEPTPTTTPLTGVPTEATTAPAPTPVAAAEKPAAPIADAAVKPAEKAVAA